MRRVYQIASLVFLAFSAYLMIESRNMEYYVDLGPGPGFFPFWLGALLAVLSVIWLVQASRGADGSLEPGFIPDRKGQFRVFAILIAMALFGWFVDWAGLPADDAGLHGVPSHGPGPPEADRDRHRGCRG